MKTVKVKATKRRTKSGKISAVRAHTRTDKRIKKTLPSKNDSSGDEEYSGKYTKSREYSQFLGKSLVEKESPEGTLLFSKYDFNTPEWQETKLKDGSYKINVNTSRDKVAKLHLTPEAFKNIASTLAQKGEYAKYTNNEGGTSLNFYTHTRKKCLTNLYVSVIGLLLPTFQEL